MAVLLVCTHPDAGLQLSSVYTFPSLQFGAGPPTQAPPAHVSFVVQALPSLHAVPLVFALHAVWLVVGVHRWHWLVGFPAPPA